jgi:hypothetical protein
MLVLWCCPWLESRESNLWVVVGRSPLFSLHTILSCFCDKTPVLAQHGSFLAYMITEDSEFTLLYDIIWICLLSHRLRRSKHSQQHIWSSTRERVLWHPPLWWNTHPHYLTNSSWLILGPKLLSVMKALAWTLPCILSSFLDQVHNISYHFIHSKTEVDCTYLVPVRSYVLH